MPLRRSITSMTAGGAALLLLATGCASTSDEDSSANAFAQLTGPATAEELTIAVDKDSGPINLFFGASDQMIELVYDKLFTPSPYVAEPQGWLATEAREIDAATWEVDLRDDVTWQDGEAFTADDVVFSFNYMKESPTGRYTHHVNVTPYIEQVIKIDDSTVRFECRNACPSLPYVTLADLPIIAEHIWQDIDPLEAKTVMDFPVGTGPYILTAYSPTEGYTFTANENYFAGEPTVKTITMPIITDQSATFTALQSGEIDATTRTLPAELVAQFEKSSNVDTIITDALSFPEIKMNFKRELLSDGDFRRAISDAIDKEQMLDVVALGQGRASTQGYPHPDAPFANPDNSTPTDLDGANELLDQLGYLDTDDDGIREANGEPIDLIMLVDSGLPSQVSAAELAVEDLGKVGIGVTLEGMDAASLSARVSEKNYDLQIGTIGAHGVADPDQFIMSHLSGYLGAADFPWEEWDTKYAEWLNSQTYEERLAIHQELQTIHNAAPTSVPLYYPEEHWAVSQNYGGWIESPGYGIVHKWSFLPGDVVAAAHSNQSGVIILAENAAPVANDGTPVEASEHAH